MRCYGLTLIQGSEFRFFHLPTTTRPINIPDSNSRFSFSNSNFFPSKLVSATFMTPVSLRITARAAVNDELMTEEVAVASGLSFWAYPSPEGELSMTETWPKVSTSPNLLEENTRATRKWKRDVSGRTIGKLKYRK